MHVQFADLLTAEIDIPSLFGHQISCYSSQQ